MRIARLLVLPAAAAVLAGCGGSGSGSSTARTHSVRPRALVVYAEGLRVAVIKAGRSRFTLPERVSLHRGRARVVVAIRRQRARRLVRRALAAHETRLALPVVPLRSSIAVRPVRQVLHNDCEVTALSMLLAATGVQVRQLELQSRLPHSGPLDPEEVSGNALFRWGDPERGFVGRPAGGGTEGGFGVYEPPIRRLAARFGVHLDDLHEQSVMAVRAAVLAGRPVLAWVGLAAGPYLSWLTPSGRTITVNLNEHAVTLVGAGPGFLLVNNPLSGKRERWSDSLFSYRWKLLGRRALALP